MQQDKANNNVRETAAPPPVRLGAQWAVPVDMERLVASVRFDVASQVAEATAAVEFVPDGRDGLPVFDLRQQVARARLDGARLSPDSVAERDIGAGPGATVRVLDVPCAAASKHLLEVEYQLGTPKAGGALPVGWQAGGVVWDFWMSDLEPGRYLEMWFPANLCHDRLALEVNVEVSGTSRAHALLANGRVVHRRPGSSWTVRYPHTFTSLSPLLVLAPADAIEVKTSEVQLGGRALRLTAASLPGVGCDLGDALQDSAAWLGYFTARYGAWAHGDELLTVIWDLPRGMEYDGATTASFPALEHEIFHSWFGRGVKPALPRDGWIDEAMASWATASRHAAVGRFAEDELGLDEPPALLCPPHPWSRHTPRAAYTAGARLLAGVARMAGGPGRLRAALAGWHARYAGRGATTEELKLHLGQWCGRDLSPWWDRYVHGQG
ncbi:MAG TPA: hypothetical protein VME20_09865 [Acidimicrobiales bacterium]|nr:hypothetical protein [Acidimicrobiales bacterium]